MTQSVYVGVDSGGTRTNVKIASEDGNGIVPVDTYETADSLSGALPDGAVLDAMRAILAPLESRLEEDFHEPIAVYIWISAAGYTPWTRPIYVGAMRDLLSLILDGQIHKIGAANDGISLLLGSGSDAVVIAGTGSNTLVRTRDGAIYQAGGHEWVACDYGSGFWIGLLGIRQAYVDFEAGQKTVLLQRLCEQFSVAVDDAASLISHLRRFAVGDKDMKKDIARFAPAVCAAAERGDRTAQNLVKKEAESLADVTATALRRRLERNDFESGLQLLECGSVVANPFYRTSFEGQVKLRLSDLEPEIQWTHVTTAEDQCLHLARQLVATGTEFERIDAAFRPAIVEL